MITDEMVEKALVAFWCEKTPNTTMRDRMRAALGASIDCCIEELADALREIDRWSRAYPIANFPEPDFARVREILAREGITIDAVSASNMRHVTGGVGRIARTVLKRLGLE